MLESFGCGYNLLVILELLLYIHSKRVVLKILMLRMYTHSHFNTKITSLDTLLFSFVCQIKEKNMCSIFFYNLTLSMSKIISDFAMCELFSEL